ncbi:dihydrofolate reductase family protein [Mesorhizobium sp. YR577]|uniref:dihydrofolate reductase family protein n=1 Tax=Mesorhizobium sp. YR577 TaxID=1884373 RepID=UPI000B17BFBA|nr:dihydrofolate reductase family protein [Mesorhizobium sp. YR577]
MFISIPDMSMSLDGYIADTDDYLDGEDGERCDKWAEVDQQPDQSEPVREFEAEWKAAGAVLAGRRAAELMDHWGGSHGGLPIFVPSHRARLRPRWGYPMVTYVRDGIESAMAQAKAAAGERNVQLCGAYTALRAGVLDEIQIHLIPVLLGGGSPALRPLAIRNRIGATPDHQPTGSNTHPLPRVPITHMMLIPPMGQQGS